MAVTTDDIRSAPGIGNWRTPLVIIVCGCVIALLSFGPRSSLGFFVQPMGREFSWGRDVFGLALAVQNLLWGLGQPIAHGLLGDAVRPRDVRGEGGQITHWFIFGHGRRTPRPSLAMPAKTRGVLCGAFSWGDLTGADPGRAADRAETARRK